MTFQLRSPMIYRGCPWWLKDFAQSRAAEKHGVSYHLVPYILKIVGVVVLIPTILWWSLSSRMTLILPIALRHGIAQSPCLVA